MIRPGKPDIAVSEVSGGVEFGVIVSAGSAKAGVRGAHGDLLKVAVHAAPERGKANAEVAEVVGAWLGVPSRLVRIAAGEASRRKRLRVEGVGGEAVRKRLGG